MIAYNKTLLKNIFVVRKAKALYSRKLLSDNQMQKVLSTYAFNLFSNNIFIKIGLFLFTCFAVSSVMGLISLFFLDFFQNNTNGFPMLLSLLMAACCIVGLELVIKSNRVFHSGIDNGLLYSALGFVVSFFCFVIDKSLNEQNFFLLLCFLTLPFLLLASIRYADVLAGAASICCLYIILFLLIMKTGDVAKIILPFAMMIVSATFYFNLQKAIKKYELLFWINTINTVKAIALFVFYLAGNYFVIREASISFFGLQLSDGQDIPFAIFFYIFTAFIPLAYVYYALKAKNKLVLWIGMLLVALSAVTFRHYFNFGHPEIILCFAGILLIACAYFSIFFLKKNKYHITFEAELDEDNFLKSNLEAIILAHSFGQASPVQTNSNSFGGGDFGGAGGGSAF